MSSVSSARRSNKVPPSPRPRTASAAASTPGTARRTPAPAGTGKPATASSADFEEKPETFNRRLSAILPSGSCDDNDDDFQEELAPFNRRHSMNLERPKSAVLPSSGSMTPRPRRTSSTSTATGTHNSNSNSNNSSSSTSIQVCVRCRPPTSSDITTSTTGTSNSHNNRHHPHKSSIASSASVVQEPAAATTTTFVRCCEAEKTIQVDGGRTGGSEFDREIKFDQVFGPESTQQHVYETAVRPMVKDLMNGINCTIMAYGQTGTGKTYTMEGSAVQTEGIAADSGIIPRVVSDIFEALQQLNEEFTVRVSCLEIYNEELIDLTSTSKKSKESLQIMEDRTGMVVPGINMEPALHKEEVFRMLKKCVDRRRTAETELNAASSRSHCIFTIILHVKESTSAVRISKLNLVDLAGAECVGKSRGDVQEAGNINKSLLTLGRVIATLADGRGHVPFRESKLTKLLKDSLGGATRTCIIATIGSHISSADETLSTLHYASTARNIRTKPCVNRKTTPDEVVKQLRSELLKLKSELESRDVETTEAVALREEEIERWRGLAHEAKSRAETLEERLQRMETELALVKEENENLKQAQTPLKERTDLPTMANNNQQSAAAGAYQVVKKSTVATREKRSNGGSSGRRKSKKSDLQSLFQMLAHKLNTNNSDDSQNADRRRRAFVRFCEDAHARLPPDHSMRVGEMISYITKEWGKLSQEEKHQYREMAGLV